MKEGWVEVLGPQPEETMRFPSIQIRNLFNEDFVGWDNLVSIKNSGKPCRLTKCSSPWAVWPWLPILTDSWSHFKPGVGWKGERNRKQHPPDQIKSSSRHIWGTSPSLSKTGKLPTHWLYQAPHAAHRYGSPREPPVSWRTRLKSSANSRTEREWGLKCTSSMGLLWVKRTPRGKEREILLGVAEVNLASRDGSLGSWDSDPDHST